MAAVEPQAHMPPAAHLLDPLHGEIFDHQHRLGTAVAAGLQHIQGLHVGDGQKLRRNGAVHIQLGPGGVIPVETGSHGADFTAEFRDIVPGDGKSGCQLVTAVAFQQIGKGSQGSKQVKAAVAAGAGLAVVAVQTDQESRAGKFLGNAAGNDAHHSLMPVLVCQDNGLRGLPGGEHGNGLPVDLRLHCLPLAVQVAKGLGHRRCPLGILGQKQLNGQINLPHAPGGVDPGGQHKADGGGVDGFRGASGLGHQCGDAGAFGVLQGGQTPGDEDPVFPQQGHHIGHGAQADHVCIFFQHFLLGAAQSGGQLEGHAHTGEILMGITPIGAMGIHHGAGLGQDFLALMVVGDHQIHPQLPAQLCLSGGGNAAVHGDDQLDPFAVELADGNGIQAVALLQPPGNIADAVCALAAKKIRQKTGGGDTVHVIVTKYRNFFSIADGKPHPSGGKIHIRHQIRVRQGHTAVQVLIRLGGILNSPGS